MVEWVLVAAVIYGLGWFLAVRYFAGIEGPVPVPGRSRRDRRDALFWPAWLALLGLFWIIERRRQAFEEELLGE